MISSNGYLIEDFDSRRIDHHSCTGFKLHLDAVFLKQVIPLTCQLIWNERYFVLSVNDQFR